MNVIPQCFGQVFILSKDWSRLCLTDPDLLLTIALGTNEM